MESRPKDMKDIGAVPEEDKTLGHAHAVQENLLGAITKRLIEVNLIVPDISGMDVGMHGTSPNSPSAY